MKCRTSSFDAAVAIVMSVAEALVFVPLVVLVTLSVSFVRMPPRVPVVLPTFALSSVAFLRVSPPTPIMSVISPAISNPCPTIEDMPSTRLSAPLSPEMVCSISLGFDAEKRVSTELEVLNSTLLLSDVLLSWLYSTFEPGR